MRCHDAIYDIADELQDNTRHSIDIPDDMSLNVPHNQKAPLLTRQLVEKRFKLEHTHFLPEPRLHGEQDPTRVLYARIKLYTWEPVFDVLLSHLDHNCSPSDKQDIRQRRANRCKRFNVL